MQPCRAARKRSAGRLDLALAVFVDHSTNKSVTARRGSLPEIFPECPDVLFGPGLKFRLLPTAAAVYTHFHSSYRGLAGKGDSQKNNILTFRFYMLCAVEPRYR